MPLFEHETGISLTGNQGARVRHGPCPFCQTSAQSRALAVYTADPDDQHWHCFACGRHGDAIDAIAAISGLSFLEAVRQLARNGNIALPEPEGQHHVQLAPR